MPGQVNSLCQIIMINIKVCHKNFLPVIYSNVTMQTHTHNIGSKWNGKLADRWEIPGKRLCDTP